MNSILEKLKVVPQERSYWLVRTKGGLYYDDFIKGNYIGIAWNKIKMDDVLQSIPSKKNTSLPSKNLIQKIQEEYPDVKQVNNLCNQLINFVHNIKKNDVVLIPSKNCDLITFGIVDESVAYTEEIKKDQVQGEKACEKRKSVTWVKKVSKNTLDPYLYKLIYSHHAISDARDYSSYIDRTMYDFFIKNNTAHLVLKVDTDKDIKANDLFPFGTSCINMIEDFNIKMEENFDSDNVTVKLSLNSPGKMEILGTVKAIFLLSVIVVAINGGGFSIKYKDNLNINLHTDGIIKKISDYQQNKQDNHLKEELTDKIKAMDIKSPQEIRKLLYPNNKENPSNTDK